jgi:transposase-like protein
MKTLSETFCINRNCKDYGIRNSGNIRTRGIYGIRHDKLLLYCHTCGQRFSYSRSTAFFGLRVPDDKIKDVIKCTAGGAGIRETGRILNLDKDTVNRIVLKAEKHCEFVLSNLIKSLKMNNEQLDMLISFIEKRKVLKR